ncbi:MAG: Efflux ABC transporter, permease/ATP-binding protein SCO0742, partial [uncultured Solirubrobacteraceae bacterium]
MSARGELLARMRPHRRVLAAATSLGLLGSAAGLAQPLAAREVLEALERDAGLAGPLLVLGLLVLAGALVSLVHFWLLERTAQRVVLEARRGLVARLLRLRQAELDGRAPGDLVARATSDTTLLGEVSSTALVQVVNGAVGLAGAIVLMGIVDLPLLGTTACVLAVVGAGIAALLPRISRAVERAQAAVGDLGGALERALGAIRTVKASGAEPRETQLLGDAALAAHRAGLESARYQAVVGASTGLVVQLAFLSVLGLGGARVAAGTLGVADLVAFLLYLFYLSEPIAQLAQGSTQLQGGLAALRRLAEVEALPIEPEDDAASPPPGARGDAATVAALRGVTFAYPGGREPVLRDVDLAIPARGLTAVVGPSGAGKTTLFALLERFYEPTSGTIEVLGTDLARWPRAALRAQIAYVEQEAPVLAGSLAANLRYGAPDAPDAALDAVLEATGLDELVARLPAGLATEVGARGVGLSGGERQRIAIARALLRSPRLLLLDEASSQLDAGNEQRLGSIVAAAARERAVVAIAHRLSTVVAADRIVVLDAGRVRAVGTHAELVEGDALYRELA